MVNWTINWEAQFSQPTKNEQFQRATLITFHMENDTTHFHFWILMNIFKRINLHTNYIWNRNWGLKTTLAVIRFYAFLHVFLSSIKTFNPCFYSCSSWCFILFLFYEIIQLELKYKKIIVNLNIQMLWEQNDIFIFEEISVILESNDFAWLQAGMQVMSNKIQPN